ncbi:MAG: acyl-ACP--UDP-N-acetylglucosamine O-acyltransferase [Pseudomonadota bacterium]
MTAIHATAIISPHAQIHPSVEIGPHVIIDEHVRIGARTKIFANAYITGHTTIGQENEIHIGTVIGHDPQDFAFDKTIRSYVEIGSNNIIREYCTIHRGTKPETATTIGNNNFLMVGTHAAHNVTIGNNVITANNVLFGGYVAVGDNAFVSGGVIVHQFVTIGRFAMLSGNGRFSQDIPSFLVALERNSVEGINLVGLRRAGFSPGTIREIKNAYKIYYLSGLLKNKAIEKLEAEGFVSPEAKEFINFIKTAKRPLVTHISRGKA